MTIRQTREQRIEQLLADLERLQTKADAYACLADRIDEMPAASNVYARHWRAVARMLREDAARLREEADEVQARVEDLIRARKAAEAWVPPDSRPSFARPQVTTVARLLAEDE